MRTRIGLLLMAAIIAAASGCSTSRHEQRENPGGQTSGYSRGVEAVAPSPSPQPEAQVMGPPEPFGPPSPPPSEQFGPEPEKTRGVVLVLGPGMARAFASVGVLRGLAEAKIPVMAILGSEMGSLMAALYALNPNINRFEWLLMRFNDEVISGRRSFLTRVFEAASELPIDRELDRAFGDKRIQETQIPLRIAIEFKNSGLPILADHGKIKQAVRAALAVPGFLDESLWEGVPAVAAEKSKPFPVDEAQALRLGPVVVLDPGPSHNAELDRADLVLAPELSGIGSGDYDKTTDIEYQGKLLTAEKISEIRTIIDKYYENGGARP